MDALITATIGISAILSGWLAVQAAWCYLTGAPADADALAGRIGCHQCECRSRCENRGAGGAEGITEKPNQTVDANRIRT